MHNSEKGKNKYDPLPTPTTALSKLLIKKYDPSDAHHWNALILQNPGALFVFQRQFMDYHADQFTDHSLLLLEQGRPVALFPANCENHTVYSHQGLTFGGLIPARPLNFRQSAAMFFHLLDYYRKCGVKKLIYKQIPEFLRFYANFEEDYFFHVLQAQQVVCHLNAVVPLQRSLQVSNRRERGVKRALKQGCQVVRTTDFTTFWEMLGKNLYEKFKVLPVHSLQEISLLASRFPENIALYTVQNREEILAGAVLFFYPRTTHAQYIASSEKGRACGAVDLLFDHLLRELQKQSWHFSLGISNTRQGNTINRGLLEWKESWGGETKVHRTWEINPANCEALREFF